MRKRLIRSMWLLSVAAIALTLGFMLPRLNTAFARRTDGELKALAAGVQAAMEASGQPLPMLASLSAQLPQVRITWIDAAGNVSYDSDVAAPDRLDNHAGRAEVVAAREHGEGMASRHSTSLGESTRYYARLLADGSVLRLARLERSIVAEVTGLLPSFVLIGLLVMGLSVVLAELLTRRLTQPLDSLNLDEPLDNDAYEELTPLLKRLAEQKERIRRQAQERAGDMRQVLTITESMAEGLVVLSAEGKILLINASAARLLGEPGQAYVGRHYLTLVRSLPLHEAMRDALAGDGSVTTMDKDGSTYQVLTSPVAGAAGQGGAILLLLDISSQRRAEAMRHEFTANVSHELKSPLTTIAGYAEMMHTGIADAADSRALAGKILAETKHLLAMIEDILSLSRLDEMKRPERAEPVDLAALARDVVRRMTPYAQAGQVTIALDAQPCRVVGMPALLEEMLRNLVDNAIRYNRAGGHVAVAISQAVDGVHVAVSDSGIGIDAAHQERIFERFYRVDKSHSRQTGGTGLGLAIVKHAAMVHGGSVRVQSEVGEGSRFEVWLPGEGI